MNQWLNKLLILNLYEAIGSRELDTIKLIAMEAEI